VINFDPDAIDWAKTDGLVPAVVQDARSLRVLMLGYMNREALQATLATGLVTFFSRSKQKLWKKGETSGHVLRLRSVKLDCDQDALLVLAEPEGPTCHKGTTTCWGEDEMPSLATLADLAATIKKRHAQPEAGSYTSKLFESGLSRIAQKVGEEGVETALAGATGAPNLDDEAADLLYHLFVLLEANNKNLQDILNVLHKRAKNGKTK
jgi:phosphoribosyl-ATP pyrophosphohydrolase/phosphoribosyl-AMP cyclohydrolase